MTKHCPYKNCNLCCITINQHNARYASIKNKNKNISKVKMKKSVRINYKVLANILSCI
jgi:hypothetical protein